MARNLSFDDALKLIRTIKKTSHRVTRREVQDAIGRHRREDHGIQVEIELGMPLDQLLEIVQEMERRGWSIGDAAAFYEVPYTTLARALDRLNERWKAEHQRRMWGTS